jgi:gas vesicle protein
VVPTIFKKERNMTMSAGKILLGAVIAFAAGAALGVLFAPDKGSTTRKKLSKQGSRYLGAAKDTASEYVDTLEEKFESVKDTAVGITDKVKNAVDSLAGHEPPKHTRRA